MQPVQLDPPFRLQTPLGPALCPLMFGSGNDDVEYLCFLEEFGEPWWFRNSQVRLYPSITEGRFRTSPIAESDALQKALAPHRARHAKIREQWKSTE